MHIPRVKRALPVLFMFFTVIVFSGTTGAQELSDEFTYEEFLAHVKKYHPIVRQANLVLSESQAKLLKARGAFDPKLEADFSKKNYDDKTYYSLFNGSFKIPTWYGIEIKAAFDKNEGVYMNPENYVPQDGLTSFGITVPVGQGLWINDRMAELRKGKFYVELSNYERTLATVEAIAEASEAYMNWKKDYEKVLLYEDFYQNAVERQEWIVKSIVLGELPPIDSVESGIVLKTRKLEWEQALLKLTKSRLTLSNYLWTEDNIPLELSEDMVPEEDLENRILDVLAIDPLAGETDLENHPKINALYTKLNILEVDRKLKANSMLPKLSLSYNYISEPSYIDGFRMEDYKIGATFSFPIFLRKERAEVKLADIKLRSSELGLQFEKEALRNKIRAQYNELNSYQRQIVINEDLVGDYRQMLEGEVKLFEMGESSIFFINTRENNLVKARVSDIDLKNTYFLVAIGLYKILAMPEEEFLSQP
ncbi:Outer membrane protein TolC [Sinomicrobium oceani]|uniref:Outer membrane protein TolC n=1 Tax=Sinomicrobium oceani TaxID=1150368 RepID=A0A1K1PUW8_9FLAO|nr:TolC family protein [Sinomicrobium oceani]SFW51407.1 Outer membrane protein TolC [Sinomicrobium oceani]